MRKLLVACTALVLTISLIAAERIDENVFWKIRQEGAAHSQILKTVQVLSDVYAPRLTGSPNLKASQEWAIQQMQSWGLTNGHLEPFDFGHPGWLNERLSAHIVSPVKDALVAEALGWTPGTNGAVRATAMQLAMPPQNPTEVELNAYFDKLRPMVKGKIVLAGPPGVYPISFNPIEMRREQADLERMFSAQPGGGRGGGPNAAGNPTNQGRGGAAQGTQGTPRLNTMQVGLRFNEFLLAAGVVVRINDAAMAVGQIRAFNTASYDPAKAPTAVMMRNEDYGRIWRLIDSGRTVELEFEIVNRAYPEGRTSYNAIAEIRGTDKADEVVMLGGHMDAWHAGTGATDNAVGVATMMEAARILKAIGVAPRRTIRVALWGGEEQGLLGSLAYVAEHFGTFEEQKPDYGKFAGYLNIDEGTGQTRGLTAFGPQSTADVLKEILLPFKDIGVVGANTTRSRNIGDSDHTAFNRAGLPGINAVQDPIQYYSYTWHTSLDTYERILEADVQKSAVVLAATAYHLAMRDELLPRFTAQEMPARPAGRGGN